MQTYITFALTLCLCITYFSQSAEAKIYKWVDESGVTQYTDTPPPTADHNHETFTQTLDTTASSPLANSITLKTRRLLQAKKFTALNTYLATFQAAVVTDISKEEELLTAYRAFEIYNESFAHLFDVWIKETPNSYQPYLARARFYYNLGWEARGGSYRNKTSDQSIKEMTAYFNQATEDLKSVLTIKPNIIITYTTLINISKNIGGKKKTFGIVQQALSIASTSYLIRQTYLSSLQPRWGGSIKLMDLFATTSQQYVKENPRLKLLIGEVFTELARIEREAKNYGKADKFFTEALRYGESRFLLYQQSSNHYRLENYDKALTNINKAIKLYPDASSYYYFRSTILIKQHAYPEAVKNLQYAEQLDPYSGSIKKRKSWLANKLVRKAYDFGKNAEVSKQIEYCTIALQLEPNHAKAYSRRARGHIRQNNLVLALQDAKEAIRLQPKNVTSYDLIDYILAFDEDWDNIIKYWSQYIALNPNDGHAYVERGGAYYRSGNLRAAVTDAKTSADLGNPMGKRLYKKFKNKLK